MLLRATPALNKPSLGLTFVKVPLIYQKVAELSAILHLSVSKWIYSSCFAAVLLVQEVLLGRDGEHVQTGGQPLPSPRQTPAGREVGECISFHLRDRSIHKGRAWVQSLQDACTRNQV